MSMSDIHIFAYSFNCVNIYLTFHNLTKTPVKETQQYHNEHVLRTHILLYSRSTKITKTIQPIYIHKNSNRAIIVVNESSNS